MSHKLVLELFEKIVKNNFTPACWIDRKYKPYPVHDFLLAALLAMSDD